jgi:hypothetical protein
MCLAKAHDREWNMPLVADFSMDATSGWPSSSLPFFSALKHPSHADQKK